MNRRHILHALAICSTALRPLRGMASTQAAPKASRRGVSLAGAEFGASPRLSNEEPGEFGKDYTYNSERTVAYFSEHGIPLLRIPFLWERIQPRLGQALDSAELNRLRQVVSWASRHRAAIVLDVHNYGRYHLRHGGRVVAAVIDQDLGQGALVTRDHFADLWSRLSEAFRDEPAVEAYGLMNEPHDMGRSDWKVISQAAVSAIRRAGDNKRIWVAGDSWSNAEHFAEINGRPWIDDPAGRTTYEAHCYFDADSSGKYEQIYEDELARDRGLDRRGERRVGRFIEWCRVNRVPGVIGEFGVPASRGWLRVLEGFLKALDQAGMESCWWAAGEWWGKNKLSLQPSDDYRQPAAQMAVLLQRSRK